MNRKIEIEEMGSVVVVRRFVVRGYIQPVTPGGWFGQQLNGDMTKHDALKTASDFFTASEPIVRKLIMG